MQDSNTSSTFLQTLKPPNFPEHEQLKCPRCDSTNTKFCYYNNYNLSQPRHFCKNCRRYWTKGGALRNVPVGGGTRKTATKRSGKPKNREIPCPEEEPVLSSSKPPPTGSSKNVVPLPLSEPDPTRISDYQHRPMGSTRVCEIAVGRDGEPGAPLVVPFSLPLTGSLQISVPVLDSEPARMHGPARNQNQADGQEALPIQSSSKSFSTGVEINPVRVNDPARIYNGEFSSILESSGQFLKLLQGGSRSNGPGLGLDSVRFPGLGMDGLVYGTDPVRVPGANVGDEGQNRNPDCWNGGNGWPDRAIFTPGSGFQ